MESNHAQGSPAMETTDFQLSARAK
jgi:hypothetical protein